MVTNKQQKTQREKAAAQTAVHSLDRGLPMNIDAERAAIGAILLDNSVYHDAVANGLKTDDFFYDSHRRIFAALELLCASQRGMDFVTLSESLQKNGEYEVVGGGAYIMSLTDGLPRIKHLKHYVDIIHEKRKLRDLIHLCTSMINSAYEGCDSAADLFSVIQDKVSLLQANGSKKMAVRIGDFVDEVYADLEKLQLENREVLGLSFGFTPLDKATTGIRDGEYWIFAGFTSTGKSSLAIQSALANALQGIPVVIFTLEMLKEVILHRVWSVLTDIAYAKFRSPSSLRNIDFQDLQASKKRLADLPIYVDDAELEIGELVARMRMYIAQYGVKAGYVDFLQIVNAAAAETTQERVSMVSRCLRSTAKVTNAPMVGVSQLARPEKADVNAKPNKHMLKNSGDVENDAHGIVLTYMPVDKQTNEPTGNDELILAKQRAGPIGAELAEYDKRTLSYRERGFRAQEENQNKQMALGAGQ